MEGRPKASRGSLATLIAAPLLMFVCCGLPVILGAVGLTAAGAFILAAKDWIIGGTVFLVGLVLLILRMRSRSKTKACDCVADSVEKDVNW